MFGRTAWVFCCLFLVGVTWASADDNTAANKIFVETVQLLNQAAAAKPSDAIGLYEQALGNLDRIVAEYSSSNLAVQLASGQPIGQVSRAGIEKALGKAKCYQNPVAACVLAEALEIARDMSADMTRVGAPDTARLDPFRLRALTAIAGAQAKAGDAQEASKALTDTLEIARNIKGDASRGWLLAAIAEAQAKAGNARDALDLARNIKEDLWRARALRAIAEAQAKAGNVRDALETARSIKNDYPRTEALIAAMMAQVKAGDAPEAAKTLAEAFETARNIKEDGLRAGALRVIARAQVKVGDAREATKTLVEALETSHNIKEDLSRSGALSAIAEAQARSGDVRDALETVRRIEDGTLRAWVLAILTETLVDMGVK